MRREARRGGREERYRRCRGKTKYQEVRERNEQPAKGLFPELALISDCNHALFLINLPRRGGVAGRERPLSGRLDYAE